MSWQPVEWRLQSPYSCELKELSLRAQEEEGEKGGLKPELSDSTAKMRVRTQNWRQQPRMQEWQRGGRSHLIGSIGGHP